MRNADEALAAESLGEADSGGGAPSPRHDVSSAPPEVELPRRSVTLGDATRALRAALNQLVVPSALVADAGGGSDEQRWELEARFSGLFDVLADLEGAAEGMMGYRLLRFRERDLVAAARSWVAALEPLARVRNVRLTFDAPAEAVPLFVDIATLESVALVLGAHVVRATKDGGAVRVAVESREHEGRLVVDVAGPPPTDPALEVAFRVLTAEAGEEPSHRVSAPVLVSALRVWVKQHAGRLDVADREDGGVRVSVVLQRGRSHLDPSAIVESLSSAGDSGEAAGTARVQALFDGSDIHAAKGSGGDAYTQRATAAAMRSLDRIRQGLATDAAVFLLGAPGPVRAQLEGALGSRYALRVFDDVGSAKSAAARAYPELIIATEDGGGWELCRSIKSASGRLARTPILLMLDEEPPFPDHEPTMDADDILLVPFGERELRRKVRNLIRLKQQERQLFLTLRKLEESQEDLVQSKKIAAMTSLAAGIAHEVNNPLTGVMGMTQLLRARMRGNPDSVQDVALLDTIEHEARRIHDIVHALLMLSQRRAEERTDELDLGVLLDDVLHFVEREAIDYGIEIVRRYQPNLAPLIGSRTHLLQAFLHLVNNSRNAMENGGRLTVEAGEQLGVLEVRVIDTGHGIPADVLERIFEPFFTTKNEWHGQGLGLTYAFRVFEQHGGLIRAESEVGKGTTMIVRLPAARTETHIV